MGEGATNMLITDFSARLAELHDHHAVQLLYYGLLPSETDEGNAQLIAVTGEPGQSDMTWHVGDLQRENTQFPALSRFWPAALWQEREIWEQSGVQPMGHPDLRPILHPETSALEGVAKGSGVFHLPLGPVRADVSESGLFLFDTLGEQIMHMQPQLFFKHRDMERLAVGQRVEDVLLLAERISGTSTVAHATAFCRAIERASGGIPSSSIESERALLGEFERLYNHAHDFAQMASAAGMTVGQAQLSRVKEELLRLFGQLTGSRYLRNTIYPMQPSKVRFGQSAAIIRDTLQNVNERLQHFILLLLKTPTFVDRYHETGILTSRLARAYGVVGPTARASGMAVDARQDYLSPLYAAHGYRMASLEHPTGDAYSRLLIRVQEWDNSYLLIASLLDELSHHEHAAVDHPIQVQAGMGIGLAESPRGRVAHVVRTDQAGRVTYWGIRSASSWNWPIFGLVTANRNIQTDFPVIDASFGLSYAGNDR